MNLTTEEIDKVDETKYLEKVTNEYDQKIRRRNSKIIFIAVMIVACILLVPAMILFFRFGIVELGWFANYDDMHLVDVPIEEPAKGGQVYLPKEWEFEENGGWFCIKDKEKDLIIGYQIYKGYENYNPSIGESEWVDKIYNPNITKYNVSLLSFEPKSNGSNNCLLEKSNKYFKLSFCDVCNFKDESLQKRRYSIEFLIINCQDEKLLKKISASYSWGGEV